MISADPLYLTTLRNSHESLLRVTAYEAGEPIGELSVASCTLTLDGQGDIQRSASIAVAVDQIGTDNRATLERLTTRAGSVTIEHGVTAVQGAPLGGWNLLCTLRVESVERETGVALHTISAFDRTLLLQEHKLPTARPLEGTYLSLIKALVNETLPGEGDSLIVDPEIDQLLEPAPGKTFGRGDDRLAIIQEMAAALGGWLICDPDGSFHLAVWPEEGPNAWDVSHGVMGTLVGAAEEFSRRDTYNAVGIEFTPITGDDFRGYIYLWDDDPTSPTWYDGPFGKRNLFYDEEWDHLPSAEEAERVARRKLAEHSGFTRGITLTAIYNPLLLPGDRIVVRIPDEAPEIHVCDLITIELGPSATMHVETRFHRMFDPPLPDISIDPLIWLRADDLDPDDWASIWRDASGNNNHFHQALNLARPISVPSLLNGHQVLRFDGDDTLGRPMSLDVPATVFVVARSTEGAGSRWAFSGAGVLEEDGEATSADSFTAGGWTYHPFTTSTVDPEITVTKAGKFEYLVIGGAGGAGGSGLVTLQDSLAGGGGAGRVLSASQVVDLGTYSMVVGEGGAGGAGRLDPGGVGSPSSIWGTTAAGGGGGAAGATEQPGNGLAGASGGGGKSGWPIGGAGGEGVSGHDGAPGSGREGWNDPYGRVGGGGGGAGASPGTEDFEGTPGKRSMDGGQGIYLAKYDVSGLGSPQGWFGGGGTGGGMYGNTAYRGIGGQGGGGGDGLNSIADPGVDGTGGGGGASGTFGAGAKGGDGLIVVRHPTPPGSPGPQ